MRILANTILAKSLGAVIAGALINDTSAQAESAPYPGHGVITVAARNGTTFKFDQSPEAQILPSKTSTYGPTNADSSYGVSSQDDNCSHVIDILSLRDRVASVLAKHHLSILYSGITNDDIILYTIPLIENQRARFYFYNAQIESPKSGYYSISASAHYVTAPVQHDIILLSKEIFLRMMKLQDT